MFASAKGKQQIRFDRYSRQKQCIDDIPYYLSGLSRAHFSDNFSRNSCIHVYVLLHKPTPTSNTLNSALLGPIFLII